MSKRYREPVDVRECAGGAPASFRWRGAGYHVLGVLGHWREDATQRPDVGLAIPQRDLWRVEARCPSATPARNGVYELVRDSAGWRLSRVWD